MSFKLFLIIPPGFEELAQREIGLKCPVASMDLLKGGIELEANHEWIWKAHCLLKIPTRILMRLTSFKVRDFPKLHQKMDAFDWNKFLSHPRPQWEISCSKSRLMHTGRIEEILNGVIEKTLIKQPLSKDWEKKNLPPQTFYVRIVDDDLTLSLDLTGEPLYKRNFQIIKGEAPIRENFAAGFLLELFEEIDFPVTLVDPMCGSATMLTEALNFHKPLHLRSFAFESAPFFKGKHFKLPQETTSFPIKEALGFDLNQELTAKVATASGLNLKSQDSVKTPIKVDGEMLMICNPPYGERIKIEGKRGSFLRGAWEKFLKQDRPYRFAWVLPSDMDDLFARPFGYELKTKKHFKNGGMAVTYWIWQRLNS